MLVIGLKNDLILFDRGYPSRKFIAFLEECGIKYVMRCQKGTMLEVTQAKDSDQNIGIVWKDETLTARVLRFQLDSGIEEVLVTNVLEETLGITEFKDLYFKRWGIESKYDELKNKLQIENFTGYTPLAIEQDFYASLYLINMVSLLKNEANEIINHGDKGKKLKYTYKVNTSARLSYPLPYLVR
ncbi:transposase [Virgibacillus phasianinus]|uniref:transposase n=1 Tax=Virgibacillus phasianinus TaxID=2017483 RepID=UPI0012FE503B